MREGVEAHSWGDPIASNDKGTHTDMEAPVKTHPLPPRGDKGICRTGLYGRLCPKMQ